MTQSGSEAGGGSIVIVSGSPGTGKTTLSASLAKALPKGLHLVSDSFYEFIPNVIPPSLPESREQNHTIMRALAATSAEFARGGYRVHLEGVIGPWMLHPLRPGLEGLDVHYLVLEVSLSEALRRVRERQGGGLSPVVRQMHGQLAELGPFASHRVDASVPSAELVDRVTGLLDAGALRLDWSQVELPPG